MNAPWTLERVRALRERVERERSESYFIEGVRFVVAASDAGARFRCLVLSHKLLRSPLGQMLARRLRARGIPALVVSPAEFRELSQVDEPQGLGAVVASDWRPLPGDGPSPEDCWLLLSEIRAPGNLGTLMRTAAASGARGLIVLGSPTVDPLHPGAVRASMGALYSLTLVRTTFRELVLWRRRFRPAFIGATPEGSQDYRAVSYRRPVVLVLGSERKGLDAAQRALCNARVRIPMVTGDSLNLAIAGSLLLYEVWRQRCRSPIREPSALGAP